MTTDARFSYLFHQYINGTASAAEKREFFEMADQPGWQEALTGLVDEEMLNVQADTMLSAVEKGEILNSIYKNTHVPAPQKQGLWARTKLWQRAGAVAAMLALLVPGIYFYLQDRGKAGQERRAAVIIKDVAPGRNTATLTLASGKVIRLNDSKSGIVMDKAGLAYNDGTPVAAELQGPAAKAELLTASTPKGGTYQVTLPDGTHVWLNAASSITYPIAFTGSERKVEITGEAYFEVVHDDDKPFLVASSGQVIEDLGTAFNVNTYRDEQSIKTTLVEGAVKVSSQKEAVLLKPGQQAQVSFQPGRQISLLAKADIEGITAWKNGLFKFRKASLQEVMRQLSRWYNVEVRYEGKINQGSFTGEITRNVNLSQILDLLRFLDLKFTISQQDQKTTITVTQ